MKTRQSVAFLRIAGTITVALAADCAGVMYNLNSNERAGNAGPRDQGMRTAMPSARSREPYLEPPRSGVGQISCLPERPEP